MFTGIIECAVPLAATSTKPGGARKLTLQLPKSFGHGTGAVKLGDSIAVNGCCLTVAELKAATRAIGPHVSFIAVPETLKLTNIGDLRKGSIVNIERAMLSGQRLDGHLVQGHVDAVGTLTEAKDSGGEWRLKIAAPKAFCAQCIWKGSICLDGISLTIAELDAESFTVAIIPHTWQVTALSARRIGDRLNLEGDVIGKYVRRHLEHLKLGR